MNDPKTSHSGTGIAIVAVGAVLPGAFGVHAFAERLHAGLPMFTSASLQRWDPAPFSSGPEALPSMRFGMVEDSVLEQIRGRDSQRSRWGPGSLFCAGAMEELRASLPVGTLNQFPQLTVLLGTMGADAMGEHRDFIDARAELGPLPDFICRWFEARDQALPPRSHFETSSFGAAIESVIRPTSEQTIRSARVDSACSSALSAFDCGIKMLRQREADAAIVGGVESRLGASTLSAFNALKLLSPTGCFPFDASAEGIVPGEGAVLFLLMRETEAQRLGLPRLAILDSMLGVSNGAEASLIAPSASRTASLLRQSWGEEIPDYIECHGTGTKLGDRLELQALEQAFSPQARIPIGSAKAVFGHTLGAAGAVGVLKALTILRQREIPPAPYLQNPIGTSIGTRFLVSDRPQSLPADRCLRVGVSSIGFGGTLYHLILRSPNCQAPTPIETQSTTPAVLVAWERAPERKALALTEFLDLKIPPSSLPRIDPWQLAAVALVRSALERSLLPLRELDPNRIMVISAGDGESTHMKRFSRRFGIIKLVHLFPAAAPSLQKLTENYPATSEEAATAIQAAYAGRVAQFLGTHGKTFHVDADAHSLDCALNLARAELSTGATDLIFILYLPPKTEAVFEVYGLADASWAARRNLPVCGSLAPGGFL